MQNLDHILNAIGISCVTLFGVVILRGLYKTELTLKVMQGLLIEICGVDVFKRAP